MHLYLMQAMSGALKIGRSADPKRRRRSLETQGGRRIVLLAVLEGEGHTERAVHADLAPFRRLGEWFEPTRALREYIGTKFGITKLPFPLARHDLEAKAKAEAAANRAEFDEAIASYIAKLANNPRKRRPLVRRT